ncbi:MAG: aminotransferase class V-fold PLP-dependent enzyme [Bryobacterales bacterium]|nr:aminotransferase class V-fold PLP-dependent enzyme [Bryobacterales bacterium]
MERSKIRAEFPITGRYAYFNNAAIAPLPRAAAKAMSEQADSAATEGVHGYARWANEIDGLRVETAAMLGCDETEVAITKNTSEGLCAVAGGLDWRPGDVVVGLETDFPANVVPWRELQGRRGVRFRSLELRNGRMELEDLDRACRGARLAALSYVHFLTGFRWDLAAVGEVCRRRGCLLVVDAVQGMGPFPIDVKSCGIHALSASGHKWLVGPEGTGLLYIDRDLMPQIPPIERGWGSMAGSESFRHDLGLHPSARRYECGTLNAAGCAALGASMRLLNSIGSAWASREVNGLASRLAEGAAERGYRLAAERDKSTGSGIVSLRKPGVDATAVVGELLGRRVSVAERMGWIRVAPHIYNTAEEIDRLLALLP